MAFRALLFSKSPETSTTMTTACETTGIRCDVCSDIFGAIEKGKTRAYSCVIVDWADQPEASFLLKRARESTPNRETVAIAIVDREPTAPEMKDNRLGFLIYRPISVTEAEEVLGKASENMPAARTDDSADSPQQTASISAGAAASEGAAEQIQQEQNSEPEDNGSESPQTEYEAPALQSHSGGFRQALAVVLVLTAAFCLWRSRDVIEYLARTPEGKVRVLRESFAALFYVNQGGALPVGSAGSDAQQDAYFSRNAGTAGTQTPTLGVAETESTLTETRLPTPKAYDFPLPVPVFEQQEAPPVRVQRAAIPESMRNSPPIERPVVVTVNPAQMMPVSTSQPQGTTQQSNEPVAVSEAAARAMLTHTVDPIYPAEGLAQKLQGPVVLQALVGRDGSVEDLKIVRGYFVLGRAAIAAVKQWRFQPSTLNGHAASMQTVITINFSYPPG
jgi:TonB family protein